MDGQTFYDEAVFRGNSSENPPVTWKRRVIVSPTDIPPAPVNIPANPGGGLEFARGAGPGKTSGFPGHSATVSDMVVIDAHRYAKLIDLSIPVTTTSFRFLDQPIGKRNFLLFRNAGANVIYIGFAGDASANSTLQIAVGVSVLFDVVVPQDDLYVASAGASILAYAYSTFPG